MDRNDIHLALLFASTVVSQIEVQRLRLKYNGLVSEFNDMNSKLSHCVHIFNREHVELTEFDKIVLYPHVKVKETSNE